MTLLLLRACLGVGHCFTQEDTMCVRCIGATFFTSLLLGAALGVTVISVRSYVDDHARQKALMAQKNDNTKVSFYFEDAPLREVTNFISNATSRSIHAAQNVNLNLPVTFISKRTMSKEDAFKSFMRLLKEHELTASIQGSSVLIQRERPLPVSFSKSKGYKASAPVANPSILVGAGYPSAGIDSKIFARAQQQLMRLDRLEGAVVKIESLGCLADKVTFKTVAIGSVWSRLGFRAGDSFTMTRGLSPFVGDIANSGIEIERNGDTVRLQYVVANDHMTVIEQ
jgi:hypothetical protein